MGKRVTDYDAFAAGIAAYAMVQSLLSHLKSVGTPSPTIIGIVEDAAQSIELVSQQMRPKHPAMARAVLLLQRSASSWERPEVPASDAEEIQSKRTIW
jgi:hypothetical protein